MAKKSNEFMMDLFDEVVDSVGKGGGSPMMKLIEMQQRYGIPGYIETGYPSWDLHLMHSSDNSQWGFPYGRVSEMFGAESSLKTRTCYELMAENVKRGGHSHFLTYELDFEASYVEEFLRKRGIEEHLNDLPYSVAPIISMKELNDKVKRILAPYKKVADKAEKKGKDPHKVLPPICICVDSMGAMLSHGDRKRLEKDSKSEKKGFSGGKQVGGKASEIHNFFQLYLLEWARLGVAFVYTNHYRDNIGYGNKKYNPAHDSALKYYPSLRLDLRRGYDKSFQTQRSHNNINYKKGWIFKSKTHKIRQEMATDGVVEIKFYENLGLDYIGSLVDAAKISEVARLYGGVYTIDIEDEDKELAEHNGEYSERDLRDKIKNDVRFRVLLKQEVMRTGPTVIQEFE